MKTYDFIMDCNEAAPSPVATRAATPRSRYNRPNKLDCNYDSIMSAGDTVLISHNSFSSGYDLIGFETFE